MAEGNHPPLDPGRDATTSPSRSSTDSRTPGSRSGSAGFRISPPAGSSPQNRHNLSEALRGVPPGSPRDRRQHSFTQAAIQSLIDHPPPRAPADPAFSGRDWTQITIGELTTAEDLKFVEEDTGIEDATNVRMDL